MVHLHSMRLARFFCALVFTGVNASTASLMRCRSLPGEPLFPSTTQLADFNASIDGRLIEVVPSGKFCQNIGGCSDAQWADPAFREAIPGAMIQTNWEQDYIPNPPSICFRNTTVCGQGYVPVLGINATSVAHIQAGVRFAQAHNLRVAIKASGHDYLGRSTAKSSLLFWTRNFKSITFHESFKIGGQDKGSAVTVGSGVGMRALYQAAKAHGKIFVGGEGASVALAGGYLQGGGYGLLSPLLGLGSDNALEFQIVIANGSLLTASEAVNADLFWALRGGGAATWGVITSATIRTFPTFNAVLHKSVITLNSSAAAAYMATLHASHIFDWDDLHVGHSFDLVALPSAIIWTLTCLFPNTSLAIANASLAPFLNKAASYATTIATSSTLATVNDLIGNSDASVTNVIQGSRLIPEDVFRNNASAVGETYQKLLNAGVASIYGHMVTGGQVANNAVIDSAVTPKWRTAKAHVMIAEFWDDTTPADEVNSIRDDLTQTKVPILDALAGGSGSGSYSNEADVREPLFQTTFFGPNYPRMSEVKGEYDSMGLFIVAGGVWANDWDLAGLCRVN